MSRARSEDESTSPRRVGRPRVPGVDEAILDAALRLLAEQGYARMSLDAVAAAAGVSKPTLYRRWSSKAALATSALGSAIDAQRRPPDGIDLRAALVFVLDDLRERLCQPHNMALVGTLLAEETQTPELITLFRDRVWRRRAATLEAVLAKARERGELHAETDLEATIDLLVGAMYARHVRGRSLTRRSMEDAIDTVLRGVAADGAESVSRARSRRAPRRRCRS